MIVHVVGMGLAGSWMAWELLQRGIQPTITSRITPHTSSMIAAGLINPVTGIPPKENWNGVEILKHAHSAYLHIERALNLKVWHNHIIRRVFAHEKDASDWNSAADKGLSTSWKSIAVGDRDGIHFPFGGVEYEGATIDTQTLLHAVAQHTSEIVATKGDLDQHTLQAPSLTIWCEGWEASQNELWKWLPFEPVKGEILDALIPAPILHAIHIGSCWIIPIAIDAETGMQRIRIGSTYDWDDLTHTPTEAAKSKLLARATQILERPIEVIGHQAAVRPAARSKRPYLGRHPKHSEHAILNGLGAKGSLWAPWAASKLAAHLFDGQELDPEVDICRWWVE